MQAPSGNGAVRHQPHAELPGWSGSTLRRHFATQVASMHAPPPAQELASWHSGEASPGVMQNPSSQTVAAVHEQQSELIWHSLRQTAFTHTCPPLQSELAEHSGVGP
jgi:hypothetical protein